MTKPLKRNYKAGDKDIEIEFDKDQVTPVQMRVNGGKPMPLGATATQRSGPNSYFAEDGSSITQTTSFVKQVPLKYTDANGQTVELKEVKSPGIKSDIDLTDTHRVATGSGYQASQDPKINDNFEITNTQNGVSASIRMRTTDDGVSRFSLQVTDAQGIKSPEMEMPITSVSYSKSDPTTMVYRFDDGASLTIPRAGGSGTYVEADGTRHGAISENELKANMVRMSALRQQQEGPSLLEQMESGATRRREQTQQEGPSLLEQMESGAQRRRDQIQQPTVDEFAAPRVFRGYTP